MATGGDGPPLVFLTFLPFSHGFGGHLPQTIEHWSDPLPFPRHKNNQVRHNVWYETNMWKHNMKNDIRPSVGHFQVGQCMSHAYTLDKRIEMIQNARLWTSPRVPQMTCYFLMKCSLLRCLSSFGTVSLSKMFNHESSSLSHSQLVTSQICNCNFSLFYLSIEVPTSCEWSHVNLLHSKHLPGI